MPILLVSLASICILSLGILMFVPTSVLRNAALGGVEWLVHLSAPTAEITAQRLSELMNTDSAHILLFDVRERAEYDVSHLAGAIHLSPSITDADFARLYGGQLQGKNIVFYCSVGKRSGDAGLRVEAQARTMGAADVFNLRGGIFRWHNSGFAVVNSAGATARIHPFNNQWKLLVQQ